MLEWHTDAADAGTVHLRGELTICHAAEVSGVLGERRAAGTLVAVDLDGVTDFDSAGAQVLLVFQRATAAGAPALRVLRASPVVRDALETLRLDRELGGGAEGDAP